MPNRRTFSDRPAELVRDVAARFQPTRLTEHDGDVNFVAAIDERVVVKAPQNNHYGGKQAFGREFAALQLLEAADVSPTRIPKLIEASEDPAYLVVSYVLGRVASGAALKAMSQTRRARLGRQLGSYILRQTNAVDVAAAEAALPTEGAGQLHEDFRVYLGEFDHPAYPTLQSIAHALYWRWYAQDATEPNVFIHGDLQPHNMTLDGEESLFGVFDFGQAAVGKVSQEVSAFSDIDPVIFDNCVRELQSAGIDITHKNVTLWREMRDLAVLPYWIKHNDTSNQYFVHFRDVVVRRYPDLDWSELFANDR